MTPMLFYVGSVVAVTMSGMLFWRADQRLMSLFVYACGAGAIVNWLVPVTYDAIEAAGRMEPIAALIGSATISIMVGITITSAICDWFEKKFD